MANCVVDASVVLAYLNGEPSMIDLEAVLFGAHIGAVNFAEVLGKLADQGRDFNHARAVIETFKFTIHPADAALSIRAAMLRARTRSLGLSLGDRFCLALAEREGKPVFTADRAWAELDLGVDIRLIR